MNLNNLPPRLIEMLLAIRAQILIRRKRELERFVNENQGRDLDNPGRRYD